MNSNPLRLFAVLFLVIGRALAATAAPADAPNFVVILADDLGYGDLGCYGSTTIATPRLDQMAREGVRFTDFYVGAPFCSPSRAALLTGRLPARAGVPYVLFPTEHTGLPPREVTIPEVLKPSGYVSACIGKWHLGWRRELRPQMHGFDEFFGLLHTNDVEEWTPGSAFQQLGMFGPLELRDGDRIVEAPVDQATLTQRYTQRALDFIRRNRERRFFLYLAHTMPHVPQYASAAFAGKSKDGIYGDAIEELDWSTGQIVDTLRELGIAQRTLVIFLSDNGANARAARPNPKARFPGRSFGGSNGPLRAGKGSTFEGGIRVPCIAWWPGHLAEQRTETTPASGIDFLPTFAALAGAPMPANLTLDGIDLRGLLQPKPVVPPTRPLFHYFGVQLQAVREGPWKLILPIDALPTTRVPSIWFDHQPGLFERQHRLWPKPTLYDLSRDIGEANDVAATHPEIVERLQAKAHAFDARFQKEIEPVLQLPGPKQPKPGQIREASYDARPWTELSR